jgi:DNA-binding NarL/FixJ family response regulator
MLPAETAALFKLLTKTELRILALVARGHSSKQIAAKTFTTIDTVRKHRENLRSKLGLTGDDPNALLLFAVARRNELAALFPEDG